MPTFQSIGMHPELRSRLVTQSNYQDQDSVSNNTTTTMTMTTTTTAVETPQALLSRNPATLRLLDANPKNEAENAASTSASSHFSSKLISLPQVKRLREEVAQALVAASGNGKRLQRLDAVTQREYLHSRQPNKNSNDDADDADEHAEEEEQQDSHPQQPQQQEEHAFRISGTVSALTLLRYDALKRERLHHDSCNDCCYSSICCCWPRLSTGCVALDKLLELPDETTQVSTRLDITTTSTTSTRPSTLSSSAVGAGAGAAGVPFGYVTQFAGPPGSGKTQLALQIAASPFRLAHTWYLCSTASLASYAERLEQLSAGSNSTGNNNNHNNLKTILDRTRFVAVTDEYQVLAALAQVEAILEDLEPKVVVVASPATTVAAGGGEQVVEQQENATTTIQYSPPCLLVLDSASGCLSTELSQLHLLQTVACTLKRLARQYSLAVVVTNGSVPVNTKNNNNNNTTTRTSHPALGRAWKEAADISVWVEALPLGGATGNYYDVAASAGGSTTNINNATIHQATLEHHPAKKCSKVDGSSLEAYFRLHTSGIQDAKL